MIAIRMEKIEQNLFIAHCLKDHPGRVALGRALLLENLLIPPRRITKNTDGLVCNLLLGTCSNVRVSCVKGAERDLQKEPGAELRGRGKRQFPT
jgi:hypothetical protein